MVPPVHVCGVRVYGIELFGPTSTGDFHIRKVVCVCVCVHRLLSFSFGFIKPATRWGRGAEIISFNNGP